MLGSNFVQEQQLSGACFPLYSVCSVHTPSHLYTNVYIAFYVSYLLIVYIV